MVLGVTATQLVLTVLAGVAAGVISGLFGLGGGVVAVPAALWISASSFHEAKAASLMVIVFGSTIALARHHRAGNVRWQRGLRLAGGGVAGSILSSLIAQDVAGTVLGQAFGVLVILVGLRMALAARPEEGRVCFPGAVFALGFFAGTLTGFLGVGGGVVMTPGLALFGFPMHAAVATSLVGVIGNGFFAAVTQAFLGMGEAMLTVGVPLAVGAMLGGRAGAKLALVTPADKLRRAFGVFLALVGLRFLGVWEAVVGRFR
ncbi:hypothetical protein BRD56_01080 [Thermoplasmatales archaeon SW_10_69_26]|nr:MAG: hypothetical protein BRD56_01080 [Thermoplasmatales archaeon SW_10_69_26]